MGHKASVELMKYNVWHVCTLLSRKQKLIWERCDLIYYQDKYKHFAVRHVSEYSYVWYSKDSMFKM